MPVQLTYAITTTPNPLTAGAADGILTLMATNNTGAPVNIIGINIGIPDVLTTSPAGIQATPPTNWAMGTTIQSPGQYTFVFTPPNNTAAIQPGDSLVFTLANIAVNETEGIAIVIVTEGSNGVPTTNINVPVFPAAWGHIGFTALPPNLSNAGNVTLNWNGPTGAVYTIQYAKNGQVFTIPAAGGTPLNYAGTYPGPDDPTLYIDATTTFTLLVAASFSNQQYPAEVQQMVTVVQEPAIVSFSGSFTGTGASRQLTLTWETTNADYVHGSWTPDKLDTNSETPPLSLPFAETYFIIAVAADGSSAKPAYVYLSQMVLYEIAVGSSPNGVAITKDSKLAFVANDGDGTVSVIDIDKMAVTQTITLSNNSNPMAVAITPDNVYAFVVNSGFVADTAGTVSVIEISTLSVIKTITVGNNSRAIAITPDGKYAYVGNYNGDNDSYSVIEIDTLTITKTIAAHGASFAIAITPNGDYAFIVNPGLSNLSVINLKTDELLQVSIPTGKTPSAIAISPDGKKAYVTCYMDNKVSVIDLHDFSSIPITFAFNKGPIAIAISSDGNNAFIVSVESSDVWVYNFSHASFPIRIGVGSQPIAIAITPDNNYAFVANSGIGTDSTVSVLGLGLPSTQ